MGIQKLLTYEDRPAAAIRSQEDAHIDEHNQVANDHSLDIGIRLAINFVFHRTLARDGRKHWCPRLS